MQYINYNWSKISAGAQWIKYYVKHISKRNLKQVNKDANIVSLSK